MFGWIYTWTIWTLNSVWPMEITSLLPAFIASAKRSPFTYEPLLLPWSYIQIWFLPVVKLCCICKVQCFRETIASGLRSTSTLSWGVLLPTSSTWVSNVNWDTRPSNEICMYICDCPRCMGVFLIQPYSPHLGKCWGMPCQTLARSSNNAPDRSKVEYSHCRSLGNSYLPLSASKHYQVSVPLFAGGSAHLALPILEKELEEPSKWLHPQCNFQFWAGLQPSRHLHMFL